MHTAEYLNARCPILEVASVIGMLQIVFLVWEGTIANKL